MYFVDRNRKILYWNEGACRLSGYSAQELVGRSCQDDILCHVDYEGKRLCQDGCPLSASIEDGGSHEADVFLRHKQGRRVPVNVRVQPLRGADESIVGAIEIFSDNSAQTEATRRTEAMKQIPAFPVGGSWRFDPSTIAAWLIKKDPQLAVAARRQLKAA